MLKEGVASITTNGEFESDIYGKVSYTKCRKSASCGRIGVMISLRLCMHLQENTNLTTR